MDGPRYTQSPPVLPWGMTITEKLSIMESWASGVYIKIGDVLPGDTLQEARHRRTNYDAIVEKIAATPHCPDRVKAHAYQIVKRRANAMVRARMRSLERASVEASLGA